MVGYVLRRLISLFFVLLAVATIVFFLMRAVPGGPWQYGERGFTEEAFKNILAKYGLDKPVLEQYVEFLKNASQLDFGYSFAVAGNPPVLELITRVWPVTIQLGFYTLLVAFGGGLSMGIIAAYYRNGWIDRFVTFTATLGITVPSFIIATWLLIVFGFQAGWGKESTWIIGPVIPGGAPILSWDMFLPVLTYAIGPIANIARYTRSSVADAMSGDYVRTARAKGVSERRIMIHHVFRNASIPLITLFLPTIPDLLTGSLFIEVVYGVPGLGKFFVTSIFGRDYPMIMALVLLIAVFWGLTYLATDILYMIVDPRIRVAGRESSA